MANELFRIWNIFINNIHRKIIKSPALSLSSHNDKSSCFKKRKLAIIACRSLPPTFLVQRLDEARYEMYQVSRKISPMIQEMLQFCVPFANYLQKLKKKLIVLLGTSYIAVEPFFDFLNFLFLRLRKRFSWFFSPIS